MKQQLVEMSMKEDKVQFNKPTDDAEWVSLHNGIVELRGAAHVKRLKRQGVYHDLASATMREACRAENAKETWEHSDGRTFRVKVRHAGMAFPGCHRVVEEEKRQVTRYQWGWLKKRLANA